MGRGSVTPNRKSYLQPVESQPLGFRSECLSFAGVGKRFCSTTLMIRYCTLEAPSNLGLRPTGVERAPTTLLELGLGQRLGARNAGRVEAPPYDPVRDPQSRVLNAKSIAEYAVALANALDPILSAGEFPIVLGGDCSILLGSQLALHRRGRYG